MMQKGTKKGHASHARNGIAGPLKLEKQTIRHQTTRHLSDLISQNQTTRDNQTIRQPDIYLTEHQIIRQSESHIDGPNTPQRA